MRIPLMALLIFIFLNLAVDYALYKWLKDNLSRKVYSRIQLWSAIVLDSGLLVFFFIPLKTGTDTLILCTMWALFTYMTIYVAKYIFGICIGIGRIPLLWHHRAWVAMRWVGAALAAIVFCAMWWGAMINRYQLDVKRIDVPVKDLPKTFEGFTIVQLSDMHLGTYGNDTEFVKEIVQTVNALHPDMVVFTGDIVNRRTSELEPFVKVLSGIESKYGVYSVLGNHDYGDYYNWPNTAAQIENNAEMERLQQQMGWKLLKNDCATVHIGNDSLVIIGVENIGDPPFHVYGELSKAYPTPGDKVFKILLSHNPAHWNKDISNSESNIALTLSGHTHAMQTTVLGWSPSVFRYPQWGGLYTDNKGQNIYVNIGTGTVGFPARIGATPEITLLTLRKG